MSKSWSRLPGRELRQFDLKTLKEKMETQCQILEIASS